MARHKIKTQESGIMEHKKTFNCPNCKKETLRLSKILGIEGVYKLADVTTGGKIWSVDLEVCLECGTVFIRDLYVNTEQLEPKP